MENTRDKDLSDLNLKPPGSYLNSLSDFADLLGTIEKADNAAKELLLETGGALKETAPKTKAEKEHGKPDLNALLKQLDALVGLEKLKRMSKVSSISSRSANFVRKTDWPYRRCRCTWFYGQPRYGEDNCCTYSVRTILCHRRAVEGPPG